MKPDERRAIELHLIERRTLAEVGTALGLTRQGADSLIRRTRAKLMDRLARRGIHDLGVFTGLAVGVAPASVVAATVRAALARPAVGAGIAGASAHASALLSRSTMIAAGTIVALAAVAVGLVGLPPRVGGGPPPAAGVEPEVPAVKPEGLTARVVFSKDLPVGASGVAFGPNGRLALGGWMEPNTAGVVTAPGRIWNGNPAADPTDAGPHGPGPVAFRADGTPVFLILPSNDRWSLLLWDMDRNEQLAEIPLPGRGAAQVRAALSADGTLAAATVAEADDQTGHTLVWKLPADGAPVRELHHWDHAATALAFSPNNELVVVGHVTGNVSVRSVADGREVSAIRTGHAAVLAVAFGRNFWRRLAPPTGPDFLLAAGGKGGHLGVFDLSTGGAKVQSFAGSAWDVHAVAFSPDGATLVSVGRTNPIVWDVASGRELIRVRGWDGIHLRNYLNGVAFSPDGHRLAITSATKFGDNGGVDIVEFRSGSSSRQYLGLAAPAEKVWLSPDGQWVAALAQNWHLAVWRAATGRLERVFEVETGETADNAALAFVGENRVVFASGRRAALLDLTTGAEGAAWRLPAAGLNDQLAVQPDGTVMLFQSERAAPPAWGAARAAQIHRVYDLVPGDPPRERYTLAEVPESVSFSALSPDGGLLVIGGNGVMAYDGSSGRPVGLLPPGNWHDGRFSETGERLLLSKYLWSPESIKYSETSVVDPRSGLVVARQTPDTLFAVDDTHRLGITAATNTNVLSIARCGTTTPLLWLDPDRRSGACRGHLSGDGRFAVWGRTDGTVCAADLRSIAPELFR